MKSKAQLIQEAEIKLIRLTRKSHDEVMLINKNGDTFTYNPQNRNGEELEDFLSGADFAIQQSGKGNPKNNIITDWLKEHGDPNIAEQVRKEAEELMKEKPYAEIEPREVFKDYWDGDIPFNEQITVEYGAIISAMEDFASAVASKMAREKVDDVIKLYQTKLKDANIKSGEGYIFHSGRAMAYEHAIEELKNKLK